MFTLTVPDSTQYSSDTDMLHTIKQDPTVQYPMHTFVAKGKEENRSVVAFNQVVPTDVTRLPAPLT